MSEQKRITLTLTQRKAMGAGVVCPNCGHDAMLPQALKMKPPPGFPKFTHRPIVQCAKCKYWADWMDGWTWYPEHELEEWKAEQRRPG